MSYSEYEYDIFSRHFILKEFTDKKISKLGNSSISIVGIGGIGCALVTYLISSGLKNISLSNMNKKYIVLIVVEKLINPLHKDFAIRVF